MAECIHFPNDPNAVCSVCNPKTKKVDAWVPGVEAKYHGTCCRCGGHITPGDLIRATDDGWECCG